MKVASVELTPYALPFARPYVTTRGKLERRELVLVRLRLDDGSEGLGEAVPLSLRGGSQLPEVISDLERCRQLLVGAEFEPALVEHCQGLGLAAPALAAFDIALLDLRGRLEGLPVWALLGAEQTAGVRCNASLIAATPEQVASDAERWAARGFDSFKLKAGGPDDLGAVRAVRSALGADAQLRLDANGSWSVGGAIQYLTALEPSNMEFVEQPCATVEDLAKVRSATTIPIVADESVASMTDACKAIQLEACDATTLKLSKVGGISAALKLTKVLPYLLSSALDGPIGIAAAAHLAVALGDCPFAHGLATQLLFTEWPATSYVPLEGAELRPGSEPGLGVQLDEAAIAALAITVS